MKKIIMLFLMTATTKYVHGQSEYFEIFNAKFKAKEIIGNKSFNDLGLFHYTKPIINNLTDDQCTYQWRLGSVRIDSKNYRLGTFNLFNLSNADNDAGYGMLDEMDFSYYSQYGFQILDTSRSLREDKKYLAFRAYMKSDKSIAEKRKFFWNLDNYAYMILLQDTKYFKNVQKIYFKRKQIKKMEGSIRLNVKSNLSDLIDKYFKAINKSDGAVKIKSEDTLGLGALLSNFITKNFEVTGEYISLTLSDQYIAKIVESINAKTPTGNDQFAINFNRYQTAGDSKKFALNSALFAFRFNGSYKRNSLTKESMEALLKTKLNIDNAAVTKLSLAVAGSFNNENEQNLTNEFSKVWIIKFGTDARLDFDKQPEKFEYNNE